MNHYHSIFSFKRFKNLFIRDLFVNLKPLTKIVGGIFFIFLLIFSLILLFNSSDQMIFFAQKFYNKTYFIAFIAGSLFFSGNAFRDFRNKEQSMNYLMLPSSNLEKILSQYLLVTVVFTLFTTVAYYLFSLFSISLVGITTDYTLSFYEPFSKIHWVDFLRVFIIAQLILLSGAVTFKKSPVFFTGLTYILYSLAVSLIVAACIKLVFSGIDSASIDTALDNTGFLSARINDLSALNGKIFNALSLKVFYYFHQYIIGIGFALYIWFKVKEKQA